MRTVTSGLLITAFGILAGLALTAHMLGNTLLNPGRVTGAVSGVVKDIASSVSLEDTLNVTITDPGVRDQVDRALQDNPDLRKDLQAARENATRTSQKYTTSTAARDLRRSLREAGYPDLAKQLTSPQRSDVVDVAGMWDSTQERVASWRDTTLAFSQKVALLAGLCALCGIGIARSRASVAKGVCNTVLFGIAGVLALFYVIPQVLGSLWDAQWWLDLTAALQRSGSDIYGPLLPIFIGAAVLRIGLAALPNLVAASGPIHKAAGNGPGTDPRGVGSYTPHDPRRGGDNTSPWGPSPSAGPRSTQHSQHPYGSGWASRTSGRSGLPGAEETTYYPDPERSWERDDPRHK